MHHVWQVVWVLSVVALPAAAGCGSKTESAKPATAGRNASDSTSANQELPLADTPQSTATEPVPGAISSTVPQAKLFPEVLITTSTGDIKLRLNAEKSRVTVENFLESYVDRGFYTGTVFHHVEQGFMIIGGGYTADGSAKETRTPIQNEAHNGLRNRRGTIAMARDAVYADSATSQFFINLADSPTLDFMESADKIEPGYCVFGEVIEGMDVVDRIAQVAVKPSGVFPRMPVEPVTIRAIKRL